MNSDFKVLGNRVPLSAEPRAGTFTFTSVHSPDLEECPTFYKYQYLPKSRSPDMKMECSTVLIINL